MNSGIYCIKNIINDKQYIGQAINLEKREYEHFRMLKNNKHYNNHLQNSYNIYKKNSFLFKILLYCEPFELTRYEQFFVDLYTPKFLYNIQNQCVNSNMGVPISEEAKEKRRKYIPWNKNRIMPERAREKMADSHKGKHLSEETKQKISNASKGKCFSEEHKKKLSNSNKGKIPWNKGKQFSEEHRKKLSNSHKGKIPWNKGKGGKT